MVYGEAAGAATLVLLKLKPFLEALDLLLPPLLLPLLVLLHPLELLLPQWQLLPAQALRLPTWD